MKDYFKLKENKATIRGEFSAGLAVFFSMVYIYFVNANMFSNPFGTGENVLGVSFNAIFISTGLCTVIGTLLMGLLAKLPFAISISMCSNAMFVYTICIKFGMSYANASFMILICGLIYLLFSACGIRKKLFNTIPQAVKTAIIPGMGLFIALVGLKNAGIVVNSADSGLTLASLNLLDGGFLGALPLVIAIVVFFIIVILTLKGVKAAIIIGILMGMGLYYLLGLAIPGFYENLSESMQMVSPAQAFSEFKEMSLGVAFTEGTDFSAFIEAEGFSKFVFSFIVSLLSFFMVDTFGSLGSLYGACARGNMLTKDGEIPRMTSAMLSDSIGSVASGLFGNASLTAYMESAAGVLAGGKTGLTAVFASMFFAITMFLSPIANLMPSCATSGAVVFIGVTMACSFKDIDFKDITIAIPAFLAVVMTPFAYNVAYGIAFGMIGYVIMLVFTKQIKKIKAGVWIITALFVLLLILTN
ncbi:MAG: NCS2 family permease [Lachnospiraceae bacterium]|nr:NCS2 family permease [Lachnospiraceae bacterium]